MRVPNLYLGRNQKSLNKTQKIIRTISRQKPYINKQYKQEAKLEREIQEYNLKQQKFENDAIEKLNNLIEEHKVDEIQYYALLLYGIKLDKETILEKLKARKAK